MSWPALSESSRITDWSYFQTKNYLNHPCDIDLFCSEHPEVDGAVIRFVWPSGVKDSKYDYYYDGFTRNGKIVMGYGWPNPKKTVKQVVDDWLKAMGDRVPKVIFGDWEEVSTFEGKTPSQLADHMKALNAEKQRRIPDAVHGEYGRGGWLDANVRASDEIRKYYWWLAHWPWWPPDFKDQAHSFSELDSFLPIDNNFTPYRGKVVTIPVASVVGWQATSELHNYVPRGRNLDGGYFTNAFLNPIYGGAGPVEPPPTAEKAIVEVKVVQGEAEIKVI